MPNQLLTLSDITPKALPILANKSRLMDKVNRQYDERFAIDGRKIGGTANLRLPIRVIGTFGAALNVEPATENFLPISINYQFHTDLQFPTIALELSADDFSNRYAKPCCVAIANRLDSDGAFFAYQNTAQRLGVPQQRPTSYLNFSDSRATLVSEGMAFDDVEPVAMLHPFAHSSMADSLKGLLNPQRDISKTYETGMVAKSTAGADWFEDPNIAAYTTGTLTGTPVLAGVTAAAGGSGIMTSGWNQSGVFNLSGLTNTAAQCFVGDTIQVAGLFPVNPQSRVQYISPAPGGLKQFVVLPPGGYATMTGPQPPGLQFNTATLAAGTFNATTGQYTSSGSGTLSLTVGDPAIIGGQFQNAKAGAAFTSTPAVTINNGYASGLLSTENLYFHRDFMGMVMVDLPLPRSVEECYRATDKDLGISMRILTDYTVNNDAEPTRIDVAYGYGSIYRSMGARVSG